MTNNSDIANRRKKVTEYQRQGSQMHREEWLKREYNRHNYKRWPWGSFLVVALVSGVIFFVCGSPLTIKNMDGVILVVSIIFITLGSILLLPSLAAISFLIGLYIYRHAGMDCPCQSIVDRFSDRPLEPSPPHRHAELTAIKVWTSEIVEEPVANGVSHGQSHARAKIHQQQLQSGPVDDTTIYVPDSPPRYEDVYARPPRGVHASGSHMSSHHTDSEDGNEISSNYTDESEYEISPRSNPGTFHRHTPAHEPQVCNALSRRKEFSSDSQYGSFERDDNAPSSGSQHDDRTLHVDNPQDPGHHRQLKWSPYRRRKLPSLHFVRKANRRYASCPDIELSDLSDNYSLDRSYSSSQNSNHRAPRQHEPRHNSVDRRSRAALSIDREDRRYRSRSAASIGSRHPCSSDSDISPRAAARGTETQWVTVELHRPHSRQSRARSKASSRPSTARSQSRASSRPPSTHSGRHRSASDSSRRERNQNIVYIDEIQPRVHRKSHTRQHYDHNRVNSKHHMQHESRYRDRSRNNRSRSRTRSTSSTMTKQSTQRHYHQGFMKNTNAVRGYDPMSDTDTSTVASSHSPVNNTARTGYQNYGFVSDEYSPNSHSNC